MTVGDWGSIAIAAVLAGLTGLFIVWPDARTREYYEHWSGTRVGLFRILGGAGHAAAGAAGAVGASQLGWLPFEQVWILNGLVYTAAVEGVVRANIAGLQVAAPGKVWAVAELIAGSIGSRLEEHSKGAVQAKLQTLVDDDLAALTLQLREAARYSDFGRASALADNYEKSREYLPNNRLLLLRYANDLAAVARWTASESSSPSGIGPTDVVGA